MIEAGMLILGIIELATTIMLVYVARNNARSDQSAERNTQLEEQLKKSIREQIDRRFDEVMRRLERGDREFDEQEETAKSIEIRMERAIGGLREHIAITCATKEDVHEISREVAGLRTAVTEVTASMKFQFPRRAHDV